MENQVPAYGYAYFSPGIIQSYGYSRIQTQLHSVPPWATAFGFAMLIAYFSDKTKHRFLFTLIPICVALAGFATLLTVHNNQKVQYGALFLCVMGAYSAMPVIVCWFNMNLGGHHRRAVGSAWQVGFGNIGGKFTRAVSSVQSVANETVGIIAVFSFLAKDSPKYIPGYSICLGFICLSALSCITYFLACDYQNRQRDRAVRDMSLTEFEKTELGDMSPDYRYML